MTLYEAIEHCNEVASTCSITDCSNDHKQLANWLEELKFFRDWYRKWFVDSEDNINLKILNLRGILTKEKATFENLNDGSRLLNKLLSSMQDCISILNRLKEINFVLIKGSDFIDIDFQDNERQQYVNGIAEQFKSGDIDFGQALEALKIKP